MRDYFGVKDNAWRDGYRKGRYGFWGTIVGCLLVMGALGSCAWSFLVGCVVGASIMWKVGLWRTEEF